jgi:hypothetical protein
MYKVGLWIVAFNHNKYTGRPRSCQQIFGFFDPKRRHCNRFTACKRMFQGFPTVFFHKSGRKSCARPGGQPPFGHMAHTMQKDIRPGTAPFPARSMKGPARKQGEYMKKNA